MATSLSREGAVAVMKRLSKQGYGRFVLGRRGMPTRLEWNLRRERSSIPVVATSAPPVAAIPTPAIPPPPPSSHPKLHLPLPEVGVTVVIEEPRVSLRNIAEGLLKSAAVFEEMAIQEERHSVTLAFDRKRGKTG